MYASLRLAYKPEENQLILYVVKIDLTVNHFCVKIVFDCFE